MRYQYCNYLFLNCNLVELHHRASLGVADLMIGIKNAETFKNHSSNLTSFISVAI